MAEQKTSIKPVLTQSPNSSVWRNIAYIIACIAATGVCACWCDASIYQVVSVPAEHMPGIAMLNDIAMLLGGPVGLPLFPTLFLIAARPNWRHAGRTIACAFMTQTLLTKALKILTGRIRPNHGFGDPTFHGLDSPGPCCFPSGHASFAFMMATLAAAYFPRYSRWFYGIAAFVAIGRVTANRHFLGDVLAGALLGYLVSRIFLVIWPVPAPIHETSQESTEYA